MNGTLETVLLVVGSSGTAGGMIVWWISKFLNSRKEIWELQMKDQRHDEEIKELKDEFKEIRDWYNRDRSN